MKRIFLFLLVNILVVATLSITWSLVSNYFGLGHFMTQNGIDNRTLAIFALVWGMGGSIISLLMSKFMAKMFMGIHVIDAGAPRELQFVVDMTHDLARRAGLSKMPEVGYYESNDLNAFATGPSKSNSLVAVSTGLVRNMSKDEIEGVLAHEISHIKNGDMVTMMLLQGVVNAFTMFLSRIIAYAILRRSSNDGESSMGGGYYLLVFVLDLVFSILGSIVTSYFSRIREFRADEGAARLSDSRKMIAALVALDRYYGKYEADSSQQAVATLKISGSSGGLISLFATHPPISERIKNLERMI